MAIRIPIISDFDSKGLDKAVKQFEQLKTSGEKAQFALEKAALPAGLALAALGASAVVATKAAIDDAAAQEQLAGVLERQTGATQAQIEQTEKFISGLSRATAVADDQLRPALSTLVNATGNLSRSQQLLTAANDLAAATNSDVATTSDAIAKAYNGNLKALQNLNPALRDAIKDGASFEQVMATLAETTGGAAANAANTTAGRFKALSIRFGELQEEIGARLLPVAEKLVGFLLNLVDVISKHTGLIVAFGTAFAGLATLIIAVNTALKIKTAVLTVHKAVVAIATAANYAHATSITAVQVATGIGIAVVAAATAALIAYQAAQKKVQAQQYAVATATQNTTDIIRIGEKAYISINGRCVELNASLSRTNNLLYTQSNRLEGLAGMYGITTFEVGKFDEKVGGSGGATEKVIEFGKRVKEGVETALELARQKLADARAAFDEFATSVSVSVKAGLSFAAAYQAMQLATQNAGKASEALTDAQADLAKAIKKGDVEDIAAAQKKLTEAQKADTEAAKENKQTFLGRIAAQVEGVKQYSANLQTLLGRGLSQDALQYVLDAGAEAGSAIAAELVKGTTDQITGPNGINAMVAAAQTAADAVGINAATRWYQSGVDQAQQIVDGIDAALVALTPKLMARMDKIAASLKRNVDIDVRIKETVTRVIAGEAPLKGIPKMAEGGIVTKPTLALIGEAGPEAVIPLSRNTATGGNVTVNVNGGLATSAEIGQAIVNALRAYNRSAGPANIAVA